MTQPLQGPIRVSPNGRYFVDAAQQPFFWMGDTAWPLVAQYSREDAEKYLANRARKGFTVIQGVLAWGGGTGFEGPTPGPNAAGDLPWLNNDPATPNDAYFQHVDHLARVAADNGLILAMLPTWGYYVNDVKTLNTENAYAYGRWLGARYKSQPNIIWVNGGDCVPTGYEVVWRALAHGLREGDGGAHLITYHPCGWTHSSQFFHQEDWLDFNMIQTWTEWAKVYPAVAYDTQLLPIKPVVLAEGAYENGPEYPQGPITPLIVRRQAWWSFMAGGYPTYGQNEMWRMQPGWASTFDTPGAAHMSVFKKLATSRAWQRRIPDQRLFASGVGSERTLNTAVRSPEGDWAMIYLSSQCHVLIHLDKMQVRRVKATLVNPQTGEPKDAGTYETGNLAGTQFPQARQQWFSTPGHWEDALLMFDAVE
ncbi:MAG: glycoside hydrolase family 140 protein [Chloroflexi bacterium]|nr:glycoside hydrolase family 140 protein [Chloroflexota bacterium]MCL5274262.1 glycoside hydrolase family 140 protein [Chloroflexota bacterium]